MKNNSHQYLALSIMGRNTVGIVSEVTKAAAESGCGVKESRMATLGDEFGLLLLLGGNWDAIAMFESNLPQLQKRNDWQIISKRTQLAEYHGQLLPYTVQVVALDNIGLIQQISGFFSEQGINIYELFTTTYAASQTGTPMFSLTMSVNIPATTQISDLRERFILFCDDLNLDAIIEPEKS
jgi:glycine cleavage system transcriptional repressor